MPKFLYTGEEPCQYGGQVVKTGDVVDASASPGKRFVPFVEPEPVATPSAPAPEAESTSAPEEASKGRKSTRGGE